MKTDEELKQLANDIFHGVVFTSNHVPPGEEIMLGSIFMPLMLMTEEGQKDFLEKKPFMVYEYMDQAGPRSVNGYPMFMSLKFLIEDEYKKVVEYYKELEQAKTNEPSV